MVSVPQLAKKKKKYFVVVEFDRESWPPWLVSASTS